MLCVNACVNMRLFATALASAVVTKQRRTTSGPIAITTTGPSAGGTKTKTEEEGGGGMDPEDVLQIIEGVGYVVSSLPVEQADPALSAMLSPVANALLMMFPPEEQGSAAAAAAAAAAADTGVIVLHFDRLAAVMRYVAHPELVASMFRELWPVVARGLERCGDRDERSAEHICRCIKYAFRTAR